MDTQELYMIDDSSKLFRKGEEIGTLEGDKLTLKPEAKKYQASVTRWLREKSDEQEAEDTKGEPKEKAPKKKLTPAEQEAADNKGIAKEAQEEAAKARKAYQDDVEFAQQTGCEEPPKKNPQFGDKTPAYVEWLRKFRPDKFAVVFGVKGKGKVPVIKTNPTSGIDEVVGYRDADMATRKTHMTEKLESNRGLGEDMDWNA